MSTNQQICPNTNNICKNVLTQKLAPFPTLESPCSSICPQGGANERRGEIGTTEADEEQVARSFQVFICERNCQHNCVPDKPYHQQDRYYDSYNDVASK